MTGFVRAAIPGSDRNTAWPTDDPGLSRATRLHLQKPLLAAGYNIGPITRAAIAEAEKKAGLPPILVVRHRVCGRRGR